MEDVDMFFFSTRKQVKFACAKCTNISPSQFPILRLLFKFTSQDLIEYLRENSEICENIMIVDGDKRYSPATFIIPTQKNYLVGVSPYNIQYIKQVQSFDNIEEAVADYVLLNWKLPRLRPPETEKILRSPNYITFFDQDGNIFDQRKAKFKYYDQTEKKFIYYD